MNSSFEKSSSNVLTHFPKVERVTQSFISMQSAYWDALTAVIGNSLCASGGDATNFFITTGFFAARTTFTKMADTRLGNALGSVFFDTGEVLCGGLQNIARVNYRKILRNPLKQARQLLSLRA
jgi:hypothetical protein